MANIQGIGISALAAYQAALNVSSQNIANADTPYYSRRQVTFRENPFNSGVTIADVRRVVDDTANSYLQSSNSNFAMWETYADQLSGFEPLFDDDQINIGKFIQDSLSTLKNIQNSTRTANRSLYMSSLHNLAEKFNDLSSTITNEISNVNTSLTTQVNHVNDLLSDLANINLKIQAYHGGSNDSLLDQREGLIQELSNYMDISRSTDSNGVLNVFLSNGLSLLSTDPALQLTTMLDPANPNRVLLGAKFGNVTSDITHSIHGGKILGLMNYRDEILENSQIALNRLAMIFSDNLNAQNKLGIDAHGLIGGNIFNDINSSSIINNRVTANSNNVGSSNMTVNITDTGQLQVSNYRLTIGSGNQYTLTRLSDSKVVNSGTFSATFPQTISVDGFSVNIASATFNAGDQYIISPTNGGADHFKLQLSDPSQFAFGWPVTATNGNQQPGSNGVISVDDITDTTNPAFATAKQLTPPISIKFSSTSGVMQYSLYDSNTNALLEGPINYVSGQAVFPTPGGLDYGYRVSISGDHLQAGDTFNIQYNTYPNSDVRNALAMAKLYQRQTMLGDNGQKINFITGFNLIASNISVSANEVNAKLDTSKEIKSNAEKRRDTISGVDLEEETLNLTELQTAYQASAQILQAAKTIFDTIVSLARS